MPQLIKTRKTLGPTVLSATTEQKLDGANFEIPADAKTLVAIQVFCDAPAGKTATEAVMAYVTLDSNSNKFKPYTVLTAPIGSYLGADGLSIHDKGPIYPVNAPVTGGTQMWAMANGLIDHTIEPYVQCDLIFSNAPPAGPQVYAQIGTLTTDSAVAAGTITKGSGIIVENGHNIFEFDAYCTGTTVAAAKGQTGRMKIDSSDMDSMGAIEFALEPIGGAKTALDAAGTASVIECAHLTRCQDLSIPIKARCSLVESHTVSVAVTTAGKFIVGVLFT
jgi:hypothetical protein